MAPSICVRARESARHQRNARQAWGLMFKAKTSQAFKFWRNAGLFHSYQAAQAWWAK